MPQLNIIILMIKILLHHQVSTGTESDNATNNKADDKINLKKVKIKSVKALKGKKIKVVIKSGAYGPWSTKVKVKVKK